MRSCLPMEGIMPIYIMRIMADQVSSEVSVVLASIWP